MEYRTVTDQLGNKVKISALPQRIVSLVPSQTELLADLDLGERVVGITKFCVHPEHWRKTKAIVGGTKKFDLDVIRSLQPDLIIGNKEENYQEGIGVLSQEFPVWMSDIVTVADALEMMRCVGGITQQQERAQSIITGIQQAFRSHQKIPPRKTLYLIWRKPWMAAASGTFIHEMMNLAGLTNCAVQLDRYPELTSGEIKDLSPEVILLSSEPYPFKEKHIEELKQLCPDAKVILADGELFSWYGSRMQKFVPYFETIKQQLL